MSTGDERVRSERIKTRKAEEERGKSKVIDIQVVCIFVHDIKILDTVLDVYCIVDGVSLLDKSDLLYWNIYVATIPTRTGKRLPFPRIVD